MRGEQIYALNNIQINAFIRQRILSDAFAHGNFDKNRHHKFSTRLGKAFATASSTNPNMPSKFDYYINLMLVPTASEIKLKTDILDWFAKTPERGYFPDGVLNLKEKLAIINEHLGQSPLTDKVYSEKKQFDTKGRVLKMMPSWSVVLTPSHKVAYLDDSSQNGKFIGYDRPLLTEKEMNWMFAAYFTAWEWAINEKNAGRREQAGIDFKEFIMGLGKHAWDWGLVSGWGSILKEDLALAHDIANAFGYEVLARDPDGSFSLMTHQTKEVMENTILLGEDYIGYVALDVGIPTTTIELLQDGSYGKYKIDNNIPRLIYTGTRLVSFWDACDDYQYVLQNPLWLMVNWFDDQGDRWTTSPY